MRRRGGGTGRSLPVCSTWTCSFTSRFFGCFFSLVAIYLIPRSAHTGNRLPVLDADALFGSVFIYAGPRPRRLTRLGVEQHYVRRVHRRRRFSDSRLLISRPRLAVHLHDVYALEQHAAGLEEHAQHFAFLALVLATHHAHRVALRHVHIQPLRVLGVPGAQARLRALPAFQYSQFTKPLERGTRSSCTSRSEERRVGKECRS